MAAAAPPPALPPTAASEADWSKPMVTSRRHGPPTVITASLMRMATMSMARAYAVLGLRAHHGLDVVPTPEGLAMWAALERAADATYPSANRRAAKFTAEDWDAVFGGYDAVTDIAGMWADQLADAYPDARVVVLQRDFETWWPTFYEGCVVPTCASPRAKRALLAALSALTGLPLRASFHVMNTMMLGLFGARDMAGVRENARRGYDAYYERIRSRVPPERRLEYRIGEGWGPLCEFLGREVPDVPFPRVNDREEHEARKAGNNIKVLGMMWESMRRRLLGAGVILAVVLAVWWASRARGLNSL
ncbi:uncharacterized protein E0L32_002881 [Thyridium curvatum]|uniref:Uncharacterized protein n=1 Tax=Thyridium curvatum TaxID=1093900 RepID=A0A507BM42_9PEZI|nr:uncharacterized protein E0L32_002881 [Thyridium curvatum]TPX17780.1 hypothetical protein E0L32_002881 [Thyridium curvatum]